MQGGGRSRGHGNYTNPCLTMHQPWASLLVYGIKRIEGRSWPAPIRGRLWIHAASKVPEEDTIKAMEEFYREIYAVNGITDIKFPEHYPVSRLLGCVEVVGCVRCDELASWEAVPEGVRLEGQTDFCWLCENPQKLLVPFEMRGYQRVYNLERKVYESAVRGLASVKGPMAVKFPLPDARDPFSLKPGSVPKHTEALEVDKFSSLTAAIAGARAAATQFNKKHQNLLTNTVEKGSDNTTRSGQIEKNSFEEHEMPQRSYASYGLESSVANEIERGKHLKDEESNYRGQTCTDLKQIPGSPSKIFAAAVKGLKPS